MTKEQAAQLIVDTVTSKQGCKATELAAVPEIATCGQDPVSLFEELVAQGKIVEIEYALPEMNHRLKSFYLPVGTDIRIVQPV